MGRDIEGKIVTSLVPPHFPSSENIIQIRLSLDGRGVFICCKNHNNSFVKVWRPYSNDDEDNLITLWEQTNFYCGKFKFSNDSTMIAISDMLGRKGMLLCINMDHTCL